MSATSFPLPFLPTSSTPMPSSSKRNIANDSDQGSDFEDQGEEHHSEDSEIAGISENEADEEEEEEEGIQIGKKRTPKSSSVSPKKPSTRPTSSSKPMKAKKGAKAVISYVSLPWLEAASQFSSPSLPPARSHSSSYHRPGLLDTPSQNALFSWFAGVESSRDMPWRKDFIEPGSISEPNQLRALLSKRAYEVWISEIMLQQTRVSTVCEYFKKWMIKFPTIQALANSEKEDVLACWKGLGYYSRATRILEAAQKVTSDEEMGGLLPETPELLEKEVPGVGRYTAGAISSIVFGHAVPLLDGNVIRVLSRQLGLFVNSQAKTTTDILWSVADTLVRSAAENKISEDGIKTLGEDGKVKRSSFPGKWNQALMELGSTVCTPKPLCESCPIQSSCRAYAEGRLLATKAGLLQPAEASTSQETKSIPDIEDLCEICEPFELALEVEEDGAESNQKASTSKKSLSTSKETKKKSNVKPKGQQSLLTSFAFTRTPDQKTVSKEAEKDRSIKNEKAKEMIETHIKRFPLKIPKKKAREEECVVCVIEKKGFRKDEEEIPRSQKKMKQDEGSSPSKQTNIASTSRFLLEQRPDKGLLASLWEMPTATLPSENDSTIKSRKQVSLAFVKKLVRHRSNHLYSSERKKDTEADDKPSRSRVVYEGEIGNVPHVFSHLKLNMHVHKFRIEDDSDGEADQEEGVEDEEEAEDKKWKWIPAEEVEVESCGTGMRKAWELSRKGQEGVALSGNGKGKGKGNSKK